MITFLLKVEDPIAVPVDAYTLYNERTYKNVLKYTNDRKVRGVEGGWYLVEKNICW